MMGFLNDAAYTGRGFLIFVAVFADRKSIQVIK